MAEVGSRVEVDPPSRLSIDDRTQSIESIVQQVTIDGRLSSQEDSQRQSHQQRANDCLREDEKEEDQGQDQCQDDNDEENSYIEPSYDDID